RQPGQGRAGEGQSEAARLVRRPGDEGVGRQGEPAGRQRPAQGEARALTRGFGGRETAIRHLRIIDQPRQDRLRWAESSERVAAAARLPTLIASAASYWWVTDRMATSMGRARARIVRAESYRGRFDTHSLSATVAFAAAWGDAHANRDSGDSRDS